MDVEWARHYTVSEFELENVKGKLPMMTKRKRRIIKQRLIDQRAHHRHNRRVTINSDKTVTLGRLITLAFANQF